MGIAMSGYLCPACGEALPADTPCPCDMDDDGYGYFESQWPASLDVAMLCQVCGAVVDWRAEWRVCPHCGERRPSHNASERLRRKVGERDGWMCHRCGMPIDRTLAWPHPLAAVADHYPVSRNDGGPPILANLRIAHSVCNGGVPPRTEWPERWDKYQFSTAEREVMEAIARLSLDGFRHVRPRA
jgi:predicted RNA-binding Zn-ribbon protein involved in translation (DUF1610 family)